MRSDYALYTVAIIFFILTAISAYAVQVQLERNLWVITTTVLGLLFIGLGFSQRPKIAGSERQPTLALTTPVTITEEVETDMQAAPMVLPLTEVKGVGEKRAKQLKGLGINGVEDLAKASAEDLAGKLKISPKITARWIGNAKKIAKKS